MIDRLRMVPLFGHLPEADLERLCRGVEEINLSKGATLFTEGEQAETAFVIASGEIEITKASDQHDVLIAVRKTNEVIGEMALLQSLPRTATARARTDATLLRIPKARIDELLETSISAVRAMFSVILDRWRGTEAQLRQNERMAQLGTLTAGLAHELNNPAAAVKRSADLLATVTTAYAEARVAWASAGLPADEVEAFEALHRRALEVSRGLPLDALTRSDREADLESWLENIGVANAYRVAPPLVDLDLTTGDRSLIEGKLGAGVVVELLRAATELSMLVHEVREGASRLSAVVQPLKSYSYLDQAPVQEVDVVAGLEDTLMILSAKVTGLTVRRDYAPNLPRIEAYGSELNQVWTNLIDNAADAIRDAGTSDGEIAVRVFATPERLVVEIADNGPGIPDEIRNRIFDAFFTTKPPGRGTGLGLEISYGIVVNRHRGEIEVESQPGRTVFRVLLPLERPD